MSTECENKVRDRRDMKSRYHLIRYNKYMGGREVGEIKWMNEYYPM